MSECEVLKSHTISNNVCYKPVVRHNSYIIKGRLAYWTSECCTSKRYRLDSALWSVLGYGVDMSTSQCYSRLIVPLSVCAYQ